jgi:hypothetical protein
MDLHIGDAWFSARTVIHIGPGNDRLTFERCIFHGGIVDVDPAVERPVFIACLFQGTVFTGQSPTPRISRGCHWQPTTTEECMPRRRRAINTGGAAF